jgi:CRP-like cAMP-binding protein
MAVWHWIKRLRRQHSGLRSWEAAARDAGGLVSGIDRGIVEVPVSSIVGSVGRWQTLGSDFLYRTGQRMTRRFRRVAEAMAAGKALPPVELYRLKRAPKSSAAAPSATEYFVLDGHHRVAMARRLGQDFVDAHVIEFSASQRSTGHRRTIASERPLLSTIPRPDGREAQLAHPLRRVTLFRDAPVHDLVELWRHLVEVKVPAGATVCQRGEPGDRFFVVQNGSVEVRLGPAAGGTSLYRLGPGDCFGEMSVLLNGRRSADVVAMEDSVLWALEAADFNHILGSSIPLLRALSQSLAARLAMATGVIEQSDAGAVGSGPAGLRIGEYRVVAQLGVGGMAVVYSAVRERDALAVALKVLPAAWGAAPDLRARLERESTLLRGIQHPGVIRLLDIGPVDDRLGGGTFIAMEWLPYALDRVLRAQYPEPMMPGAALRIGRGVAEALAAVHATGLIHRDVKPSNILLRADGQPVLTDFGLAAGFAELATRQRLTPPNVLVGTADYLAPEVITGGSVDARADIYALGIVLYEMLTGFVPFAGRDPYATLRAHCETDVPELPASLSPATRALVERALCKDPRDRFATAAEMASAIDASEHRPSTA